MYNSHYIAVSILSFIDVPFNLLYFGVNTLSSFVNSVFVQNIYKRKYPFNK